MESESTCRSMHVVACVAGVLIQMLGSASVLASQPNGSEVAMSTANVDPPTSESEKVTLPPPSIPRRPQPGDKLGYSKKESTRLLDPEVRQLLDALLRLYREPGLFADRREAMAALGVEHYQRTWDVEGERSPGEPMHYVDRFSREGIFGRPDMTGRYEFGGWRGPRGEMWYSGVRIDVDTKKRCYDSRAVEGYLDLFLHTGLDGRPHPVPANSWDRHGAYGSPSAIALGPTTPHLGMIFVGGCLQHVGVYRAFDRKEVDDAKSRD